MSSPLEAVVSPHNTPKDSRGWDGKLRLDRRPVITNPEALSDPEYSDEDAPPVQEIEADEDLLEEYPPDAEEIDLVHCRILSIPALRLERFSKVQKLCLRQNQISSLHFPSSLAPTLNDLDLYDNLISHIKGLDELGLLTSLDLSFNKVKHIKNISHLRHLKDVYFVQNKIQKIEGLEGLVKLRNLELAANRIREIENLETLTGLEELWLGKNKITEIKNLSPLANLKILSIQSNRLPSIQGIDGLRSLEELYISHNALTAISGLEKNSQLRVLDISNNQVAHVENLKHLDHLEEFWASYNLISSFDEIERELTDKKELSTVYFEGNPLQLKNPVMYRNKVRLALPQLQQIDATFVKKLTYIADTSIPQDRGKSQNPAIEFSVLGGSKATAVPPRRPLLSEATRRPLPLPLPAVIDIDVPQREEYDAFNYEKVKGTTDLDQMETQAPAPLNLLASTAYSETQLRIPYPDGTYEDYIDDIEEDASSDDDADTVNPDEDSTMKRDLNIADTITDTEMEDYLAFYGPKHIPGASRY
ncbi:MAG: hypothetical protein M1835_003912 [Candelina submexicana]|nr:MAG: hypothetical protein M1835_003912 [Candelina submexicana]